MNANEKTARFLNITLEILKSNPKSVVAFCYNDAMVFENKDDAMLFFKNGVLCCEGCERERYSAICLKLDEGWRVVNDDMDDWETYQVPSLVMGVSVKGNLKKAKYPRYWNGETEIK